MLYTGCILDEELRGSDKARGIFRISVMSRHTECCGKKPDERITSAHYDEHWMALAPHAKLVGKYYRNEICYAELETSYIVSLIENGAQYDAVRQLIELAIARDVRILCIEPTPSPELVKTAPLMCHRIALAKHCRDTNSLLRISYALS